METTLSKISASAAKASRRWKFTLSVRSFSETVARFLLEVPSDERQQFGKSIGPRPLGKRTSIALGADRLYVVTGDSAVVRAINYRGQDLRYIQLGFRERVIHKTDVDMYLRHLTVRSPTHNGQRVRDMYGGLEYPNSFPLTGTILVDANDRLWAEEFRPPWLPVSKWTIVAGDGSVVGTVATPAGFRLTEVGTDYLLGASRDSDGVDQVRAYRFKIIAK